MLTDSGNPLGDRPMLSAIWLAIVPLLSILSGCLALVLTVPFAVAFFLAYPGFNEHPIWFPGVRAVVTPYLDFAEPTQVYATYGRIYNIVYLLWLPATVAAHWLARAEPARAERVGFWLTVTGLAATFVGVAGDYWADGVGYPLELLGLLALAVGCTVFGIGLRSAAALPAWSAWLFIVCAPTLIPAFLLVGHIPSGPTLPVAVAYIGLGVVLWPRSPREARHSTAEL